jgi:hypothetical protein
MDNEMDEQTRYETAHSPEDLVIRDAPIIGVCPACGGWHILGVEGQCGKG